MPINILMPALSPTMEKGNLAKWLKKEGDKVKSGDVIAEIETDKATMEFEAVDEGTMGKILVPEGTQDIAINAPIAMLLMEGEKADAVVAPAAAPKAAAAPAAPAPVAAPVVAPAQPRQPAAAAPAKPALRSAAAAARSGNGRRRIFASPLARRLAKEAGIDCRAGEGLRPPRPRRQIRHRRGESPASAARRSAGAAAARLRCCAVDERRAGDEAVRGRRIRPIVPHDNVRKIIARRLVEAKTTIPHFYLTVDTEIDALLALRADINAAAPTDKDGKPAWKVSVNDLVIKALAMALMRVPDANVTWTEGGMLHHKRSDIGVAVSIPGGLITPVVRHADTKRISEISIEMKDLAARARVRKLAPQEYQGGTSAVSNLGMFGVKDFAAVINPPHATILAVGAGIETPVVRDGKIEIRTIMTCTLSTDHRAVDGALGAQLFAAFKELIEKPAGMLA